MKLEEKKKSENPITINKGVSLLMKREQWLKRLKIQSFSGRTLRERDSSMTTKAPSNFLVNE